MAASPNSFPTMLWLFCGDILHSSLSPRPIECTERVAGSGRSCKFAAELVTTLS